MTLLMNFIGLLFANVLASSVFSVVAPYLPTEAEKKAISSSITGLMLSGYSISALFTSLLVGKSMSSLGKKRVLLVGCILEAFSTLGYFTLPSLSKNYFLIIGFSFRLFQGAGAGLIGTATYAIIISQYGEKIQQSLGSLQISNSLGFLIGPIGASILFKIGKFELIFQVYGSIFFILIPVLYFLIKSDSYIVQKENNLSILDLIKNYDLALLSFVQLISSTCVCFITPTYSLHLLELGVPENYYGAIFAIPTVTYMITVYFVSNSKINKKSIMIGGVFVLSLSHLLLGPWKYTYLPTTFFISGIGMLMIGVGLCMCNLTVLPIILDMAETHFPQFPKDQVSDIVSSIANSIYFVAEIYAPPLSGFLKDITNFETSQAILSFSLMGLGFYLTTTKLTMSKGKSIETEMELNDIQATLTS